MQKIIIIILFSSATLFSKAQKIFIDSACYINFPVKVSKINRHQASNFMASILSVDRDRSSILYSFDHSRPTIIDYTADGMLISLSFKKHSGKIRRSVASFKVMVDDTVNGIPIVSAAIENIHGDSVVTTNDESHGIEHFVAYYFSQNQKFTISLRVFCLPAEKTKGKILFNQLIHGIVIKE